MQIFTCGPYTVTLFTENVCRGIVYTVTDRQSAEETWHLLKGQGLAFAAISGVDWNRELPPWSAPNVFRGSEDFGGQGPALLEVLTQQVIPLAEKHLGCAPEFRGIAGYSLAGLFALWAVYQTDLFDRAASISGSLWFDGFLEFMQCSRPKAKFIYLSLGDREKGAKNSRLAVVESCTRRAAAMLSAHSIPVVLEMNRGGHFQDISIRIARGIRSLADCSNSRRAE